MDSQRCRRARATQPNHQDARSELAGTVPFHGRGLVNWHKDKDAPPAHTICERGENSPATAPLRHRPKRCLVRSPALHSGSEAGSPPVSRVGAALETWGRRVVCLLADSGVSIAFLRWRWASPLGDFAALRSVARKFVQPSLGAPHRRETLPPAMPPRTSQTRKGPVFASPKLR